MFCVPMQSKGTGVGMPTPYMWMRKVLGFTTYYVYVLAADGRPYVCMMWIICNKSRGHHFDHGF